MTSRQMDGRAITSAGWKDGLDHLRSHCCGRSRWDSQTVLAVTGSRHTPERSGRDSGKTRHACFSHAASSESSSGSPGQKIQKKDGGEKFRGSDPVIQDGAWLDSPLGPTRLCSTSRSGCGRKAARSRSRAADEPGRGSV